MDHFPGCLQGRIDALAGNHLASIPINNRQKRLKTNIVAEDIVISNTHHTTLREQATRAVSKKLKTKVRILKILRYSKLKFGKML